MNRGTSARTVSGASPVKMLWKGLQAQKTIGLSTSALKVRQRKTGISTDLDYSNMVVCCPGNIARDGAENYHCDKKKGDVDLRISPLDDTMMSTIQFTPSGLIKSTDSQLDREINVNLNLNQQLLRSNRKETWLGIARGLKTKDWNVSNDRSGTEFP